MQSRAIQHIPEEDNRFKDFVRRALKNHFGDLRDLHNGQAETTAPLITISKPVAGDSPYTIKATDDQIFVNTDAGAVTANLPAGIAGKRYRIANTGSSGNDVTVNPNGTELLIGVNSSIILNDEDVIILAYEATEGWW